MKHPSQHIHASSIWLALCFLLAVQCKRTESTKQLKPYDVSATSPQTVLPPETKSSNPIVPPTVAADLAAVPAGIPNKKGVCYINATLQTIAACYAGEVMAQPPNPLRTMVTKINHSAIVSETDLDAFRATLPAVYAGNTGGDVPTFLEDLHKKNPFLSEISTEHRIYVADTGLVVPIAHAPVQPIALLRIYPPEDCLQTTPLGTVSLDLSALVRANQEQLVYQSGFPVDVAHRYAHAAAVPLTPFVQKNSPLLGSKSTAVDYRPFVLQTTYTHLPDKLAVAFLAKGRLNQPYFHGTLHNTATLCIQHDPAQPDAAPTRYGLEAFVQAIATQPGGEPDHAIAFVKRKERWYRVNDAEVEEITELAAWEQAKNARVLFYRQEALSKRKDR
ncbi:MAG TPA: hypothetical protein VK133_00560 [Amoebophilaceae bacterium]|nr:hypothetical protein [Amoebophilaceae bacterium]